MDNSKRTNFDDRLSAAASAKKAELENFRARSGTNDPAIAERQAARQAISLARDARIAERKASRLVRLAREAGEKAARDAAAGSRGGGTGQAADDVPLQGERMAARDARHAACQARSRKR